MELTYKPRSLLTASHCGVASSQRKPDRADIEFFRIRDSILVTSMAWHRDLSAWPAPRACHITPFRSLGTFYIELMDLKAVTTYILNQDFAKITGSVCQLTGPFGLGLNFEVQRSYVHLS